MGCCGDRFSHLINLLIELIPELAKLVLGFIFGLQVTDKYVCPDCGGDGDAAGIHAMCRLKSGEIPRGPERHLAELAYPINDDFIPSLMYPFLGISSGGPLICC